MILATSNPSLSTQLAEAIPLALAACVYPPAVAVLVYYLTRDSPKRLILAYYAGAFVMTLVVGIVGIVVLGGVEITPRDRPTPSAAVDIALGAAMLATARLVGRRQGRSPGDHRGERKQRTASTRGAVLLGVVMYAPSLFYLSAMKQVADANPSAGATIVTALILTFCVLLFLEVPIVFYLLFPEATNDRLKAFDAWLHRNGRALLRGAFTIGGFYMLGTGIYRLVSS